jgi:hypothetical protein
MFLENIMYDQPKNMHFALKSGSYLLEYYTERSEMIMI